MDENIERILVRMEKLLIDVEGKLSEESRRIIYNKLQDYVDKKQLHPQPDLQEG